MTGTIEYSRPGGVTEKLTISGTSIESAPLMRSLPESRWNSRAREWTVACTPKTCADLLASGYAAPLRGSISDHAIQARSNQYTEVYDDEGRFIEDIADLEWRTQPWGHQRAAIGFALPRYASMLAMGMGTGKSLCAVSLLAAWGSSTAIILCPKSVVGVWRREFFKHHPEDPLVICLEKGTTKQKLKLAEDSLCHASPDRLTVIVVNYETAWRNPLALWALSRDWGAVILDESHRIKSPNGKASKFAYQLGKRAERRLCLTGTPMPHSPLDLYAQFRFLEPAVFGTSFTSFRSRYALCDEQFKSRVLRWLNQDELQAKFSPFSFRVESEDVLDLPEIMHEQRLITLSPKAWKAYGEMEDALITEIDGAEIEATNVLVKLLRLQQMTSGFYLDGDEAKELCRAKRDALTDLLEDMDAPCVVFCRFKHDIEAIREITEKLGRTFGEISGSRKDLTEHSTMPEGIDVMAVQEQAGGTGIDLTRARYMIWYSLSFSLGDFDQAIARVHRPGQEHPVTVYHMVAEGTVDEVVYRALDHRRSVVDEVLEVLKGKLEVTSQ